MTKRTSSPSAPQRWPPHSSSRHRHRPERRIQPIPRGGGNTPAQSDPDILRYNNPGLTVDLGVGLWGIPLPVDYDGDGLKDLLVSCPDRPYKGLYFFKNIGTPRHPRFAAAERISEKGINNFRLSEAAKRG